MRLPAAGSATGARRAAALAGAVGLTLMASLAPAAALIGPATASGTGSGCPSPPGHPSLGVTVTGPKMYNPQTPHSTFDCPSTVTVSQTQDLGNQMVQVSWTGFTPTKSGVPYSNTQTVYPVEVAECPGNSPGNSPADLANCYWAANGGLAYTNGKFGPSNDSYATTSAGGTGYADIQIETSVQNQQLGCDSSHDCSLLILPVEGGVYSQSGTQGCTNHTQDRYTGVLNTAWGTAAAVLAVPGFAAGDSCSWPYRIVVPLHFAAVTQSCGFKNPAFSVGGSPLLERAIVSWQSGLCNGRNPDPYSQDTSIGEPQGRSYFQSGGDDVALTTEPATGSSVHPYTYAPVAISSAAVTYWLDNAKTGLPYTNLELTPLLLAKMLTQSYSFGEACTPSELQHPNPGQVPPCDPGVMNDPSNLITDPEFLQLNKGVSISPNNAAYTAGIPTVQQGNSDMTWEVTRWIAANQASTSFLAGNYDEWGQHVNTFYLGTQYPAQQFVGQDQDGSPGFSYLPVFPPSGVATYQADNWLPGLSWTQPQTCAGTPPKCYYAHDLVESPGTRSLIAVLDNPDASAFMLPSFKIENAAGDYVAPSDTSMAAAVKNLVPNGSNGITEEYNQPSRDAAAYPLTMVVYAMVPTGGISHYKASKIAQWLDYVAGPGQRQGNVPGELPPGYLPLTSSMRKQTLKAAYDVLHQTGNHSHGGGGSSPSGGKSNPGGTSPGGKSSPGASTGLSSGTTPKGKVNAAFSSPYSGTGRLVLVLVLIVGGLLALAGPAAVVLGKPSGRAAVIAGWRRLRNPPWLLRGRKQP
jgi:hypothetical protein